MASLEIFLSVLFVGIVHVLCQHQICPHQCMCFNEKEANCQFDSGLTSIPQTMPDTLVKLIIAGGSMEELKNSHLLRYSNLEELRLSRNNLKKIHQYAFTNLTKLRSISIQKNPLDRIDSYTFAGLNHLKDITLIGNQIKTIRKFAFTRTSFVDTIDLRFNPTERIESNAFSNFHDVQNIHMPHNVKIIESDAFFNLGKVHFLSLNLMNVDSIGPETFNGLGPVNAMVIRKSKLGVIKPRTFSKMNGVKRLLIEKCDINRIRKESFADANASVIEFVSNYVVRIEQNATLPKDKLKMIKNNIECQCRNLWISKSDNPDLVYNNFCFVQDEGDTSPNFLDVDEKIAKKCDETAKDDDYQESSFSSLNDKNMYLVVFGVIVFILVTI